MPEPNQTPRRIPDLSRIPDPSAPSAYTAPGNATSSDPFAYQTAPEADRTVAAPRPAVAQATPGTYGAAPEAPQNNPQPKSHRGRRAALIALAVIAGLLVIAYGAGAAAFGF